MRETETEKVETFNKREREREKRVMKPHKSQRGGMDRNEDMKGHREGESSH